MSDEELFEELKAIVKDLSTSDLRRALFKLEIEGVVRVTGVSKNRKHIELIAEG
jgi:DNA-binding HxlR family transcriptional regulator